MSEQIPAEFSWIKPGVKMSNKDYPNHRAIATKEPHWAKNHACWLVAVDGGGYWQCDIAVPAEKAPITLTLTREQAEIILKSFNNQRWWDLDFDYEDDLEHIKRQIEEKLK